MHDRTLSLLLNLKISQFESDFFKLALVNNPEQLQYF